MFVTFASSHLQKIRFSRNLTINVKDMIGKKKKNDTELFMTKRQPKGYPNRPLRGKQPSPSDYVYVLWYLL